MQFGKLLNLFCGRKIFLAYFLLLTCFAVSGKAQTLQFEDLIKICEEKISASNYPAENAKLRLAEIQKIKAAYQKGYFWLSLSQLQNTWLQSFMSEYLTSTASIEKSGKEAFEAEWKKVGASLNEKEKQLNASALKKKPLMLQAFAESFWSQMRPYYKSGYLFGIQQSSGEGLPYFGLSSASIEFLLAAQKMNLPNTKTPFKLRPLTDEISKLEQRTLLNYRQTETNAEGINPQQVRFNIVNSTLKNAGELNRENRYAGALYKYLMALLNLEIIVAEPIAESDLPKLISDNQALKKQLEKSSKTDHSLGMFFWETVQSNLEANNNKPSPDELKRIFVIIKKVMPEYFKYFTRGKK